MIKNAPEVSPDKVELGRNEFLQRVVVHFVNMFTKLNEMILQLKTRKNPSPFDFSEFPVDSIVISFHLIHVLIIATFRS